MRSSLKTYILGFAALVGALLLRWLLDPLMGDALPLVTLFGAVAAAVWLGGYRLAILTNGPSDMQRGKLERLGYLPLVDEVAISAEIGAAKPDRAAYDAVVAMLDLPREELVMVGDNWEWDVAGALDAGLAAAYYVGPDHPPERDAAHVLESVAGLPAALGLSR